MDGLAKAAIQAMRGTALVAILLAGGCAANESAHDAKSAAWKPVTIELTRFSGTAGHSREKRPIRYEVLGHGPAAIMVVASIHGNEGAGTPLVREMAEMVGKTPDVLEGRSLVLVAVANPDGLARGHRTNARGVDLNRDFPASNSPGGEGGPHAGGPFAPIDELEPETRALLNIILQYRPARIISLHQPLGCIDYDGPAAAVARTVAEAARLPVRKLGARPGSLGSWAGVDRGVEVLTIELPEDAGDLDRSELWERYGAMMMAALR